MQSAPALPRHGPYVPASARYLAVVIWLDPARLGAVLRDLANYGIAGDLQSSVVASQPVPCLGLHHLRATRDLHACLRVGFFSIWFHGGLIRSVLVHSRRFDPIRAGI